MASRSPERNAKFAGRGNQPTQRPHIGFTKERVDGRNARPKAASAASEPWLAFADQDRPPGAIGEAVQALRNRGQALLSAAGQLRPKGLQAVGSNLGKGFGAAYRPTIQPSAPARTCMDAGQYSAQPPQCTFFEALGVAVPDALCDWAAGAASSGYAAVSTNYATAPGWGAEVPYAMAAVVAQSPPTAASAAAMPAPSGATILSTSPEGYGANRCTTTSASAAAATGVDHWFSMEENMYSFQDNGDYHDMPRQFAAYSSSQPSLLIQQHEQFGNRSYQGDGSGSPQRRKLTNVQTNSLPVPTEEAFALPPPPPPNGKGRNSSLGHAAGKGPSSEQKAEEAAKRKQQLLPIDLRPHNMLPPENSPRAATTTAAEVSRRKMEFDGLWHVRNTFIQFPPTRSRSLERHMDRRRVRSWPPASVDTQGGAALAASCLEAEEGSADVQFSVQQGGSSASGSSGARKGNKPAAPLPSGTAAPHVPATGSVPTNFAAGSQVPHVPRSSLATFSPFSVSRFSPSEGSASSCMAPPSRAATAPKPPSPGVSGPPKVPPAAAFCELPSEDIGDDLAAAASTLAEEFRNLGSMSDDDDGSSVADQEKEAEDEECCDKTTVESDRPPFKLSSGLQASLSTGLTGTSLSDWNSEASSRRGSFSSDVTPCQRLEALGGAAVESASHVGPKPETVAASASTAAAAAEASSAECGFQGGASDRLQAEEIGLHPATPEELAAWPLPSRGSDGHHQGMCKPCAFVFEEAGGCRNGADCPFCHLCEPGERKRRKKERKEQRRDARQSDAPPRRRLRDGLRVQPPWPLG
eukprot:TRINITY_DN9313_c0_g1_i2.p1 TRINITY_DN9313_c0_g1~~TRINITY_DN9313_c0_g1_i2.p1  ORF type:complete len:808 (+),score=180.55 TRINITY_DN9313_c0_g1_i2:170-2593(+)